MLSGFLVQRDDQRQDHFAPETQEEDHIMKIRLSFISNKLIWLLVLVFHTVSSLAFLYVKYGLGAIRGFLAIDLLISIFLFVIRNRVIRIRLTSFHLYLLAVPAFCLLSAIWAMRPDTTLGAGINLLKCSLVIMLFYFLFQYDGSVNDLLKLVMYTGYGVMATIIALYGWNGLMKISENGRLPSIDMNSNNVGISVAYGVIIGGYYLIYHKKKWQIFFLIPAVAVLMASGSRTALLTAVFGLGCIYILKNMYGKNLFKSIIKGMFAVAIFALVLLFLWRLPFFGGIRHRMIVMINGLLGRGPTDSSTRERMAMIRTGLSTFIKNPVLGIGIDNPRYLMQNIIGYVMYLHNNYVELLAGGGIVGFSVYYGIYLTFIIKYKKFGFSRPENVVCLSLLLATLVRDIGGVFYYSKHTYLILLICFFNLEKNKKMREIDSAGKGLLQS